MREAADWQQCLAAVGKESSALLPPLTVLVERWTRGRHLWGGEEGPGRGSS